MKVRKKCVVFWLGFIFATGLLQAQDSKLPSDSVVREVQPASIGAQLRFVEVKKDFGKIRQGEVIEHTFTFQNSGDQPLVISEVKTTCGCTATEWPKEPIPPGETAAIIARFDSKGKVGAQHKVISVISNSASGKVYLSLITHIQPKLASQ
jgi:hypothetical protein